MESEAMPALAEKSPRQIGFWQSAWIDAEDDARFTLMRIARFISTVTLQALGLTCLYYSTGLFVAGFVIFNHTPEMITARLISTGSNHFPYNILYAHPFVWSLVLVVLAIACFPLSYLTSAAYYFTVVAPGLRVRRCRHCGRSIQDTLNCSSCSTFRPGYLLSRFFWAISACVSLANLVLLILSLGLLLLGVRGGGNSK